MGHAFLSVAGNHGSGYRCAKAAYDTRKEALRVMNAQRKHAGLTQIGRGKVEVYHCGQCDLWHVGHDPARAR